MPSTGWLLALWPSGQSRFFTSCPRRSVSDVAKQLICCCRSGDARPESNPVWSERISWFNTAIFRVSSRDAHTVKTENWRPSLGSIRKGHYVNLMWQQKSAVVWTPATQHQHHCAEVMSTTGLSCRPTSAQVFEPQPHKLSPQQHYAHVANIKRQKPLTLILEVFIRQHTGQDLAPSSIHLSLSWAVACVTSPTSMKITRSSGWNIALLPSPNPFYLHDIQMCWKMAESDWLRQWLLWLNKAFVHN